MKQAAGAQMPPHATAPSADAADAMCQCARAITDAAADATADETQPCSRATADSAAPHIPSRTGAADAMCQCAHAAIARASHDRGVCALCRCNMEDATGPGAAVG